MIVLSKDLRPERQIYYLGATLLSIIAETTGKTPVHELCQRFLEKTGSGSEAFFLALDWLYLLGAVNSEGEVISNVSEKSSDQQQQ